MTNYRAEQPYEPASDLDPDYHPTFNESTSRLRGSRCTRCGAVVYPFALACYTCRGGELEEHDLPDRGILATYTTVHVSTSREVPYTIGYVDLQGDVRVLAPIRPGPAEIACDALVELVVDDTGWAFTPIEEDARV